MPCVRALLKRYKFNAQDFPRHTLPLEGERWGMDLFHPQALKDAGLHLGKGMAAGAMAGATVDLFTAGSTGAAALRARRPEACRAPTATASVSGLLKGYQEISVDDAVLCLLALRQIDLARRKARPCRAKPHKPRACRPGTRHGPSRPRPHAGVRPTNSPCRHASGQAGCPSS